MQPEQENTNINKSRVALSSKERKRNQRQRQKLIEQGLFQQQPIEEAKQDLKNVYEMDLGNLLASDKYKDLFSNQKIQQLKTFIDNHKQQQSYMQLQQLTIKEKAQQQADSQIPEFRQSLSMAQSLEEKKMVIRRYVQEDVFFLLEYMDNNKAPCQNFLQIVLELCKEFENDISTKLFARVCTVFQGENLPVDEDMVLRTMEFLVDGLHDNYAAYGLLRLAFQNRISFFNFPIQVLQQFQDRYNQALSNFYAIIPNLRKAVMEALPATCFCFTSPIIEALYDGGAILDIQIPVLYQQTIIEIVCYSFTEDSSCFTKMVEVVKKGILKFYDILKRNDFIDLLIAILEETKAMKSSFFKNLTGTTAILERAFLLVQEKKVSRFSIEIINSLIDPNVETYSMMMARPKILGKDSQVLNQTLKAILKNNQGNYQLSSLDLQEQMPEKEMEIFKLMHITNLLPIQDICYRYCTQSFLQDLNFLTFDTGQGKTSLCLAIAFYKQQIYKKVFIVNQSSTLLFSDFKKCKALSDFLTVKTCLVNSNSFSQIDEARIIFISLNYLLEYCQGKNLDILSGDMCIIDEYDSFSFSNNEEQINIWAILSWFKETLGFSGSKLEKHHKNFLLTNVGAQLVDFSLGPQFKTAQQLTNSQVLCTIQTFKQAIVKQCDLWAAQIPIVIIMNNYTSKIKAMLTAQGHTVECLEQMDHIAIDGCLQMFAEKNGKNYTIFIINEEQGRGLDFISNKSIEENGGVLVIITHIPTSYLQYQQFIGRTGRIGNNGQYQVILYDKASQNMDGNTYLNKKLKQLYNQDLETVSQLPTFLQSMQTTKLTSDAQAEQDEFEITKTPEPKYLDQNLITKNLMEQLQMISGAIVHENTVENEALSFKIQTKELTTSPLSSRLTSSVKRNKRKSQRYQQMEELKGNDKSFPEEEEHHIKERKQAQISEIRKFVGVDDGIDVIMENLDNSEELINTNEVDDMSMIATNTILTKRNDSPTQIEKLERKIIADSKGSQMVTKRQKELLNQKQNKSIASNASKIRGSIDDGYFKGYSDYKIHQEMLADTIRVEKYKEAINKSVKGKTVLDVGCGSGILCAFSVKAGAEKVTGIDKAKVKTFMTKKLKELDVYDKVEFINHSVEEIVSNKTFNEQKFDVIVSEWMGYFLLLENMLRSVIVARDNLLNAGGMMIPSNANMYLSAAAFPEADLNKIDRKYFTGPVKEAYIEGCNDQYLLQNEHQSILSMDFNNKEQKNPLDGQGFTSEFEIIVSKDARLNAFVGWFDVTLCEGVILTTSPNEPSTHWKQSIFFVNDPIDVKKGDHVSASIKVRTDPENHRNLLCEITHEVGHEPTTSKEDQFTFQ